MSPPSEPMQRALELGRLGAGSTSPNPPVGAVVVRAGRIVGEGHTQPPGGDHAEVVALCAAGDTATGATLYVSLEPCSFHGRTPPCIDAIGAARLSRVVFAIVDPDERVSGSGRAALERAGIAVEAGDGAAEASRDLEAYIKHRKTGLPFVVAKYAASLDGKIAASSGDSRWVSGPETRAWAHEMRTRIDAIMTGVETVIIDNPRLTARPGDHEVDRQPLRVVADSRGRTPPGAAVLSGPARTLIATTGVSAPTWREEMAARGAEVLVLPAGAENRVGLPDLLRELGNRGILTLLVEGGGVLHGAFFDQRLVDKLHAVIAPLIIGAATAPGAVAGKGAARMRDAARLGNLDFQRLGDDILITGYPVYPEADPFANGLAK